MRHGESAANMDKSVNRFTSNHKVELTQKGHSQAQEAGQVLRRFLEQECLDEIDHPNPRSISFYTSPYSRARETCSNIVDGIKDMDNVQYKVYEEPRMREQDFGNFQSTAEEMEKIWEERAHYGHFFYRIPHGESAADVFDRISLFNETLFRKFEQDDFPNILVLVTHGIWARVFLMRWFKWSYEQFESLKNIPHCQYLIMKRGDSNKYELKSHLETWDEIPADQLNQQIATEVKEEVCFNIKDKLTNPEDFDINVIIEAQASAIMENRQKNVLIQEAFNRLRDSSPYEMRTKLEVSQERKGRDDNVKYLSVSERNIAKNG